MPITQPCTTDECRAAALAALRAEQEQEEALLSTMTAGRGFSGELSKGGASPAAADGSAAGASSHQRVTSPPGTPATPAGGRVERVSGGQGSSERYRHSGGSDSGSDTGPISPNRTVRWSDEEEAVRDNLHVGLSSRTSSMDSLHRSYGAAAERREAHLPPSAGGFHVVHTAGGRLEAVSSSARWEDVVGYSRAVKRGPFIFVSGTSAVDQETGRVMFRRDAYKQTQLAFTIIEKALAQVRASLDDIVRTRLFVRNLARDGEAISRAHGNVLGQVKPASTMVEVSRLVHEDILVIVEADAVTGDF